MIYVINGYHSIPSEVLNDFIAHKFKLYVGGETVCFKNVFENKRIEIKCSNSEKIHNIFLKAFNKECSKSLIISDSMFTNFDYENKKEKIKEKINEIKTLEQKYDNVYVFANFDEKGIEILKKSFLNIFFYYILYNINQSKKFFSTEFFDSVYTMINSKKNNIKIIENNYSFESLKKDAEEYIIMKENEWKFKNEYIQFEND